MKIPIIIVICLISAPIANSGIQREKNTISDSTIKEIELVNTDFAERKAAGTLPSPDFAILRGALLLNRAHFLHGDISRRTFLTKAKQISSDLTRLANERFSAGTGSSDEVVAVYDEILLDAAISNGRF